ncbi:MAG: type II secretion system F family protein [Candidatus Omnitrophota bacterium]|nr:type II secretion system F family protein [Candidatus Omnitrophota bacterium]
MPVYNYKARGADGKRVNGAMEAATKAELIDKLRKMGYMTTSAVESLPGMKLGSLLEKLKRISSDDMLMFYIQLSNMISAGITILMSLSTLAKQTENKALREAIGGVSRQVEAGNGLSNAFAAQPRLFSKLFVNMIKAGEASGRLDTVLMRYAKFFENQEDLKQKVKGAIFYPMILMFAGVAVTLFIVTVVIPQFAEIYMKVGIALPVPTLVVYGIGIAIKRYWYLLIALTIILAAALRYYFKTEKGALFLDTLKLRLPVIGPLYRKVALARLTRTLGTLLGSGVPILQSLDIIKEVVENEVLARVITNVRKSVERGERMSEPLKVSGEFPPDVIQMIAVGEESGSLDVMLDKIADFYDMTVAYAIKKLTAVIEPVFLVIIGGMVGFIMASMLLPMFDMIKVLRR